MHSPGWFGAADRRAGLVAFGVALAAALAAAAVAGPKGWPLASAALGVAWIAGAWSVRPAGPDAAAPDRLPIAAALLVALVTFAVAWQSQPTVTLNEGLGWDGLQYHALYQFFRTGEFAQRPLFPYHQRLGVPALASALPLGERAAFLWITAAFHTAAVGLLAHFWIVRRRLRADLVVAACGWLCLHWMSPLRAGVCYPINIDASTVFFDAAFFLLLWSPRLVRLAPLVALVGALFKESALLSAGLWLAATAALALLGDAARRPALRRRLPALALSAAAALVGKTL
ncbi:MAG: hypothetical protein JWM10_878, partial [Myxococcaceae bacterium]|nr:hypothetical protein [Myxococcaceae bacterium]